jgi:hypothetical protein
MSSKIEEAMFYVARLNPYKNGTVRHIGYMIRQSNAPSGEPQK